MSELIVRASATATGSQPIVQITPEQAGWTYVGFEVYRLGNGDSLSTSSIGRELAVIVLEGTCDITVGEHFYQAVGGRKSVFDNIPPEAVYVPPGFEITISAHAQAEIAVASAVTREGVGGPRRIGHDEIAYEKRGDGSTQRFIHHILDEHHPANKLLLVEVLTPPGNWSSYPPHKHDEEINGREAYLEETYYYRISPGQGQALQRVYDKHSLNAVLTPGDGDVVLVPRGYHPVASPPGVSTYYLNVMAGHNRVWKYSLDSDYAHLAPADGNIVGEVQKSSQPRD